MLRRISNLFFKIVSRKTFFGFFERGINDLKIRRCLDSSNAHPTARFYETANVSNTQNDKNKITVGANTHIRGELLVFAHGGEIKIGEFCYIGENSRIWAAKEILIGNNVLISHDVNIHDNNAHPIELKEREEHYKAIVSSGHPKDGLDLKEKKIIIKDNAWIGFNSIILKGITIGEGAIVGAGSVVTQDVPDYTVVAGNPAVIIKYLKSVNSINNV